MQELYTDKGACEICSTSTVQRRVDRAEFAAHAQRHVDAGDPVVIRDGKFLIEEFVVEQVIDNTDARKREIEASAYRGEHSGSVDGVVLNEE